MSPSLGLRRDGQAAHSLGHHSVERDILGLLRLRAKHTWQEEPGPPVNSAFVPQVLFQLEIVGT